MNPEDPAMAQQVVAAYAVVLERCEEQERFPESISALPYARDTIRTAIRTSTRALIATGELTGELRLYLENAYAALADFLDDELVRLMRDYNRAAEDLAAGQAPAADRVKSASWQTLRETSGLAGGIAKRMADDAAALRAEFRAFADAPAAAKA